jgi:predicted nucleotidyltransferase
MKMVVGMDRQDVINEIINYLTKSGVKIIAIFGSFARYQEGSESDIDILVEFEDSVSLLGLVRLERELSERLASRVDLLTPASISPYIMENIRDELEVIYG